MPDMRAQIEFLVCAIQIMCDAAVEPVRIAILPDIPDDALVRDVCLALNPSHDSERSDAQEIDRHTALHIYDVFRSHF
jgi:hypothetical protein